MILESKKGSSVALNVGGALLGLLLIFGFRHFSQPGTNELAGFFLGCLIFGLSITALLVSESRKIQLDEDRKRIVIDITRHMGGNKRIIIPFAEVMHVGIGGQGSVTSGTRYYDLVIKIRNGKEVHLFGGCVFEGRMSREWIENLQHHFERIIAFT